MSKKTRFVLWGVIFLLMVAAVYGGWYMKKRVLPKIESHENMLSGYDTVDEDGNDKKVPNLKYRMGKMEKWKDDVFKVLNDNGFEKFKSLVHTAKINKVFRDDYYKTLEKYGFYSTDDLVKQVVANQKDIKTNKENIKKNTDFIDEHKECIKGVCEKWEEEEAKKNNSGSSAANATGGSGGSSGSGVAKAPQLIIEMGADHSAYQKVVKGEVEEQVLFEVEWTN